MIATDQPCLSQKQLRRALSGDLPEADFDSAITHLDHCLVCQQAAERLSQEASPEWHGLRLNLKSPHEGTSDEANPTVRGQHRFEQLNAAQQDASAGAVETLENESACQRAIEQVLQGPAQEEATQGSMRHGQAALPLSELGPYRLLELIGNGGMGSVYRAEHIRLRRQCAIKILPPDRISESGWLDRFDREMVSIAAIEHHNVVRATDAGHQDQWHYLVMEYLDGMDLGRIATAMKTIDVNDACELIRQAALGIAQIHAHGLVHRDIKPSNLMLTREGTVKVLDLGLVLDGDDPLAADERLTTVGHVMGTMPYMAPEQLTDSRDVRQASDLYSLGASLYRLIAGTTPHRKTHGLAAQVLAITSEDAKPLSKYRAEIDPEVEQLVSELLDRDPDKRPRSASEVAQRLESVSEGANLKRLLRQAKQRQEESSSTANSVLIPQSVAGNGKPPRRFRRWLMGAAAAFLLLIAAIVIKIETDRGQLVIHSDHDGLQIAVKQSDQVIERLTVRKGDDNRIRLYKGSYQIEIEGGGDALVLTDNVVTIGRGEERDVQVVAKKQSSLDPAVLTYQGHDFNWWIKQVRYERDVRQVCEAIDALELLTRDTDKDTRLGAATATVEVARRLGGLVTGSRYGVDVERRRVQDPSAGFMAHFQHVVPSYIDDLGTGFLAAEIEEQSAKSSEACVLAAYGLLDSTVPALNARIGEIRENWFNQTSTTQGQEEVDRLHRALVQQAMLQQGTRQPETFDAYTLGLAGAARLTLLTGQQGDADDDWKRDVAQIVEQELQRIEAQGGRGEVDAVLCLFAAKTIVNQAHQDPQSTELFSDQLLDQFVDMRFDSAQYKRYATAYRQTLNEVAELIPDRMLSVIERRLEKGPTVGMVGMLGMGGMGSMDVLSTAVSGTAMEIVVSELAEGEESVELLSLWKSRFPEDSRVFTGLQESYQKCLGLVAKRSQASVESIQQQVEKTIEGMVTGDPITMVGGMDMEVGEGMEGGIGDVSVPLGGASDARTPLRNNLGSNPVMDNRSGADSQADLPASDLLYQGQGLTWWLERIDRERSIDQICEAVKAVELLSRDAGPKARRQAADATVQLSRRLGGRILGNTGSPSEKFMSQFFEVVAYYIDDLGMEFLTKEMQADSFKSKVACVMAINSFLDGALLDTWDDDKIRDRWAEGIITKEGWEQAIQLQKVLLETAMYETADYMFGEYAGYRPAFRSALSIMLLTGQEQMTVFEWKGLVAEWVEEGLVKEQKQTESGVGMSGMGGFGAYRVDRVAVLYYAGMLTAKPEEQRSQDRLTPQLFRILLSNDYFSPMQSLHEKALRQTLTGMIKAKPKLYVQTIDQILAAHSAAPTAVEAGGYGGIVGMGGGGSIPPVVKAVAMDVLVSEHAELDVVVGVLAQWKVKLEDGKRFGYAPEDFPDWLATLAERLKLTKAEAAKRVDAAIAELLGADEVPDQPETQVDPAANVNAASMESKPDAEPVQNPLIDPIGDGSAHNAVPLYQGHDLDWWMEQMSRERDIRKICEGVDAVELLSRDSKPQTRTAAIEATISIADRLGGIGIGQRYDPGVLLRNRQSASHAFMAHFVDVVPRYLDDLGTDFIQFEMPGQDRRVVAVAIALDQFLSCARITNAEDLAIHSRWQQRTKTPEGQQELQRLVKELLPLQQDWEQTGKLQALRQHRQRPLTRVLLTMMLMSSDDSEIPGLEDWLQERIRGQMALGTESGQQNQMQGDRTLERLESEYCIAAATIFVKQQDPVSDAFLRQLIRNLVSVTGSERRDRLIKDGYEAALDGLRQHSPKLFWETVTQCSQGILVAGGDMVMIHGVNSIAIEFIASESQDLKFATDAVGKWASNSAYEETVGTIIERKQTLDRCYAILAKRLEVTVDEIEKRIPDVRAPVGGGGMF